ncbi:RNA polymerase sigma factor [Allokutzneria albata]|uniref:RNA polymerase sigma factor, sigma-70 family n=1 Tax=Allokutzneria albata TaxID=211114 RepID=A0A1G9Z7H0_ALLAB|nr:sigma-70 family RNA polymerase sigma factor [Allokutzneria albata]SDN17310.1 RNA polymerase sigma factor, sigma-70 family [Allokutzneria albata]
MDGEGETAETTRELLAGAKAGEEPAWRALVARYQRLVWATARSHRLSRSDAADVAQLTWLRLAERMDTLRDPERLPGWLVTTARRESMRVLADRHRETPLEPPLLERPRPDAGPEAELINAAARRELWRAFADLPERCQRVLWVLAFHPEVSYARLARELGIAESSVGPVRLRCLHALRRKLARTRR